jgi:hypothetical protein
MLGGPVLGAARFAAMQCAALAALKRGSRLP